MDGERIQAWWRAWDSTWCEYGAQLEFMLADLLAEEEE